MCSDNDYSNLKAHRLMLTAAYDLLRAALADGEVEAGWVLQQAKNLGLSSCLVYLAANMLGVEFRTEGVRSRLKYFWRLPINNPNRGFASLMIGQPHPAAATAPEPPLEA